MVDSSKDLSLLFVLASHPEVDLRVLHLVRDSRAIAHSWTRHRLQPQFTTEERYMDRYSPLRSCAEWWYRNLGTEAARCLAQRYHRVRYEDLIESPIEVLEVIESKLDCETEGISIDNDVAVHLTGDHLASGNPARFDQGRVLLQPEQAASTTGF